MGTNYYAIKRRPSLHNGLLHIGKASAGWKFCFRGYMSDDLCIKSLDDWKKYIKDNDMVILDEYDRQLTMSEFLKVVETMQKNENVDNFTRDANVEGYRFNFHTFC